MKVRNLFPGLAATGIALCLASAAFAAAPSSAPQGDPQLEPQLEAARERLQEAAREVGELSAQLGRDVQVGVMGRLAGQPRAMLGVQVEKAEGGARVAAVSPGGPAEAAGIRVGDLITAVGGADVTRGDDPSRTLVERMREVEPGLKAQVSVLRDGKKLDFDVTPRAAPPMVMRGMAPMPGMPLAGGPFASGDRLIARGFGGPGEPGVRDFPGVGRFRGLELASLSERLGGYFGVKAGVLVVRAGAAAEALKLQDGDVILAIDGREPTSAAHATRILNTYQAGEKLTLRVQRDRRAQNVEVTLPERGRRAERAEREQRAGPGR